MNNPVEKLIELVGTQTKVAALCHVSQQRVSQWKKNKVVPPEHASLLEKAVAGKISRFSLAPQLRKLLYQ